MYDYHNFHRLDHIFHISWYCYRMILLLILIELPSHTVVVIEVIHYLEFIFSLFNQKLNLEVDSKLPTYTVNVWLSQLFIELLKIFIYLILLSISSELPSHTVNVITWFMAFAFALICLFMLTFWHFVFLLTFHFHTPTFSMLGRRLKRLVRDMKSKWAELSYGKCHSNESQMNFLIENMSF